MEFKDRTIEVKDVSLESRTAVIAFSSYDTIDSYNDIVRRGAFTKTFQENKSDIRFFVNHDSWAAPGKPLELWDDDKFAYAKVWCGTHTLGNDTLIQMAEGVMPAASFGFTTIKSTLIKDETIRELNEVRLYEISALTSWGANPAAHVAAVQKSFNPDAIKERLIKLEKFCRDTKASDEAIKKILAEVKHIKHIISNLDTANTQDVEPNASEEEVKDFSDEILTQIFLTKQIIKTS